MNPILHLICKAIERRDTYSGKEYQKYVRSHTARCHWKNRAFSCLLVALVILFTNLPASASSFPSVGVGNTLRVQNTTMYFVKPDGNDDLDGRSDATAWRTIFKVNNYKFAQGDDVYFKCGGTWTGGRLVIEWGGSSTDRVTIGAYYMRDDREVVGVSGSKPVIDGNHSVPGAGHTYDGLVQTEQNYVDFENLRIINSEGYGLKVLYSQYNDTTNVETYDTYRSGIMYNRCQNSNSTIKGCKIEKAGMIWPEYSSIHGGGWPANLGAIGSTHITLKNNIVLNGYGEGIGIYTTTGSYVGGYCIVEDNVVYGGRAAMIYIANTHHNIVRRNLCYGTTDPDFQKYMVGGNSFPAMGIYVADETNKGFIGASDNKIYHNLVAYCHAGMQIGTSVEGAIFKNSVVYNNTFVDCHIGIKISGRSHGNSYISNNIFWCISDDCQFYEGPSATPGLLWHHNNWSASVSSPISGEGDVVGVPMLKKSNGWRSMRGGDLTGHDFSLDLNSPVKNKGAVLSGFENALDPASVWPKNVMTIDQNSFGSGWDIGAFVARD